MVNRLWLFTLLIALVTGCNLSDGRTFLRKYNQLKLGMSKSDVLHLFGVKPDYECRLGKLDIWYIRDCGFFSRSFPTNVPERGFEYDSASDLPDTFGYVQIAFDREDSLFAFTWIGESYSVESRLGTFRGSHFRVIKSEAFD